MNLITPLVFAAVLLIGNGVALANPPNVLIIVANDLGWGDLSSQGNREIKTPHLDSLKESGLSFEKFYSCPNGSTSSATLLTGRYHYRTGVVGESPTESVMYSSEKTLAERFGENGYRTGLFGQWYHGINWPHNPEAQGFTTYRNTESPGSDAIEFVKQTGDKPFFCFLNSPYPKLTAQEIANPPKDRLEIVHQKITKLDSGTGTLLAELPENTIVVFLSDNGPDQFGETKGRDNGFFYGGKGSVHEGGVRVPCFVSWPGKIEAGSRFTRIVSLIDWYPTLAELCQLESKGRQLPIDGLSMDQFLLNGGKFDDWPNRVLFTSWTPPGFAVKQASYASRTDRWVAVRDARWRRDKSIVEKRSGWELYDINSDPFQSHDMGDDNPYLLSELKADFLVWLDQTTNDGIGPIPTQIGHPEWPVVTLESNQEKRWPVKIVKPGNYEIEASYSGTKNHCEIMVGEEKMKLSESGNIFLSEPIEEILLLSGEVAALKLRKK